ncbi:MAG: PspC domain-containing protein, partial [Chloroflexales bacterium]|nr:PspC domain-containing protein [Chloroflexales bacterium]
MGQVRALWAGTTPRPTRIRSRTVQNQLVRSANDRMISGVCGGLARYFGIDSTIVRIVFVLAVLSGLSPLIYLILWIVMPQEGATMPAPTLQPPPQAAA